MSLSGKDIIRVRNEGAVVYDRMILDHGYKAARDMLLSRVGAMCSVAIKKDELETSEQNLQRFFRTAYTTLIMTVLHDEFGFGKKRLKKVKQAFDETVPITFGTDLFGKRYITLRDCAEDMARITGMGVEVDAVEDVDRTAKGIDTRAVSLDAVLGYLDKLGMKDAYDAIWKISYGDDCESNRIRTKEQRRIAKQRRKQDSKYKSPCMNMFDPEVSKGYLAIIASIMAKNGCDLPQISSFCIEVNNYLSDILNGGKSVQDALERDLSEMYGIEFGEESTAC